jgi:hypothetical protein
MRTVLTLLVCLIGIVSGHSPIFISNDQDKMEIITDPTHSWAYYASTYLVNVFVHSYKADFEPDEEMYFEFLTPRTDIKDPPCFDLLVTEETEPGGFHLVNIAVKHVPSYLYCTQPFFDPWTVSSYNRQASWNGTATNRTRVVVFVNHEQHPYVLVVGKIEGVMFRDLLRFSYIKYRVQEWADWLTLPWSLLVGHFIAVVLWVWLGRGRDENGMPTGNGPFERTADSLFILFAIFSYASNMVDALYNYFRITNLEMHEGLTNGEFGIVMWIHFTIPILFIILVSVYFEIRDDTHILVEAGHWMEIHVGIDVLTIILIGTFGMLLFQPGAFIGSAWLFILAIYYLATVDGPDEDEFGRAKLIPMKMPIN